MYEELRAMHFKGNVKERLLQDRIVVQGVSVKLTATLVASFFSSIFVQLRKCVCLILFYLALPEAVKAHSPKKS